MISVVSARGARPSRVTGVPFRGPVMETSRWARRTTTALVALALAYLTLQLVAIFFQALNHAIAFNGYALDGAFQLYNPLRRMAVGQLPGKDFPFFHGIGMPWLHFPLFELLGRNIFASEFTRWLLSPLLFIASGYVFSRALLGNWTRAVIATALLLAVCSVSNAGIVDAANAMLGIRSMMPLFIAAAMLWPVKRTRETGGRIQWHSSLLVAYLLIGLGVAVGTEHGVAAMGAFLVVRFFQNGRRLASLGRLAVQTIVDVIAVAGATLLVLTVLTGGHPFSALTFAFRDIPTDQGWVFGSLPNVSLAPDSLVWDLQGGPVFTVGATVPGFVITVIASALVVVCGLALRIVRRRDLAVFCFLWLYGILTLASLVGYLNLSLQLAPMARVSAAIACGVTVQICVTAIARAEQRFSSRRRFARAKAAVAIVAVVAVACAAVPAFVTSVTDRASQLSEMPKKALLSEMMAAPGQGDDEIAGPGYRQALADFDPLIPPGASIWSTYTSLYSSVRGVFTPAPGGEDYIIHALGSRRETYEQAFRDEAPQAVITTNPNYTIYEEWVWGRWPGFFQQLITHYRVAAVNGSHLLWLRASDREDPADQTAVDIPLSPDGSFALPANTTDRTKYYLLNVEYSAQGGPVPIINKLARYYLRMPDAALTLWGQVLPDDRTAWQIVVPVFSGQPAVEITPAIGGFHPNATLSVTGAQYRVLDVDPSVDRLIVMNYCTGGRNDARCTE